MKSEDARNKRVLKGGQGKKPEDICCILYHIKA
jgi:hypothetical protein